MGEPYVPPRDEAAAADRFRRAWRDGRGGAWSAQVDRIALQCGACDLTRYLHVFTPHGERWTFPLAPDASLDGVASEALQRMVEERRSR